MRTKWIEGRKNDKVRTQMHYARRGIVTEEMSYVAGEEGLAPELVRSEVARGRMIIPANVNHPNLKPVAIGIAARCKINANIGNSELSSSIEEELEKLRLSVKYGADTVMDLSTGEKISETREAIIRASSVPIGTVPLYQAARTVDSVEDLSAEDILDVIEHHASQGVDYMTIHAGILRGFLPMVKERITGIVSRGGALMARWMTCNKKENPLYTSFDRICEIFKKYDVSFSLGDSLRPGCLHDATDKAQLAELKVLGELTRRAWEHDVQVMVEGPGHVPMNEIGYNMEIERELCHEAPFYVLGPLVTDVAAGYDHIASAIGGAIAGWSGASMLCYVTPKEHLGLPGADDVRVGVIAHKIAAHAADIARQRKGARDRDDAISRARYNFDWEGEFELALDPDRAREYRGEVRCENGDGEKYCSMCGPRFCSMNTMRSVKPVE